MSIKKIAKENEVMGCLIPMERFKRIFAQFFKFGIVGLSNTVISYVIYAILVYFGLHYIIASIVSFVIGVLNSFFWNHKYVFKYESRGKLDIARALMKTYIAYGFSGFVIGPVLLYVFVEVLNISKYIAPFCGLPISVPLNYIMNKQWAFKPVKRDKEG